MQATDLELKTLDDLYECDLKIAQLTKEFESLPQRKTILELRSKRSTYQEKLSSVESLRAKTEKQFSLVTDEDERLAKKQQTAEEAINAGGDFRNVEAHSKELNGYVKRRQTLVAEIEKISLDLDKIVALENQLNSAIDKLDRDEDSAVQSFRKAGGDLQNNLARLNAQRELLRNSFSTELLKEYDKSYVAHGGIASAHLAHGRCSTCNSVIDGPHLLKVENEAPLSKCPGCSRLIIVQ